ncbi:MAG: MFS transporter [Lawsonella clevelandensis]
MSALYTVVVASLLLGIGSFADRIGRRTTFAIGLVIFVLGSILAGSSTTGNALIFSRALQGVGAAFVMPSTLSNVHANFTGRDRAIAFGIWGSTISAMAAIGPPRRRCPHHLQRLALDLLHQRSPRHPLPHRCLRRRPQHQGSKRRLPQRR